MPPPFAVGTLHNFSQLAAGSRHTCGVTAGGQGFCWGKNSGILGNGQGTETSTPSAIAGGHNFRSISAGHSHTCAVTSADAVYCWGANGNGQLGLIMQNGSTVPVRAGGDLEAAEVAVANITVGSGSYSCAITPDRLTTYCWGRNDVGQLGNGATTTPVAVNATPSIVVGQKPL